MATRLAGRAETRAEQMVQREYEDLRGPTLRALRSRLGREGIRFDDADLDAFYNQAWHGLYEQLVRGEDVENRGGFLVLASYRRAIEELRRIHPDRRADADPGEQGHELDLAQRLDDRRRVLSAMEGMRERLNERERQAAALCYLHGYSRPEAAEALGLAPKRMEKLMDGVSRKLGAITGAIDEGAWCESRQSLMKAYAFGVLDPDGERYALARAHLEECAGCRAYVRDLRGVAAVVPPVWLPLAGLAALGIGGAHAAAGAAGAAGSQGSGAASGAGAGAGAGAGGAGGGLGGLGLAAAAAIAVTAAGLGAWAVVSGGGDGGSPATARRPAAAGTPAAKRSTGAGSRAQGTSRPPRARAGKRARRPATAAAATPASVSTTTTPPPASSSPAPPPTPPAATAPAPVTPAPPPAGAPQEPEFGFER